MSCSQPSCRSFRSPSVQSPFPVIMWLSLSIPQSFSNHCFVDSYRHASSPIHYTLPPCVREPQQLTSAPRISTIFVPSSLPLTSLSTMYSHFYDWVPHLHRAPTTSQILSRRFTVIRLDPSSTCTNTFCGLFFNYCKDDATIFPSAIRVCCQSSWRYLYHHQTWIFQTWSFNLVVNNPLSLVFSLYKLFISSCCLTCFHTCPE